MIGFGSKIICILGMALLALAWGPVSHQHFGTDVQGKHGYAKEYFVPGNAAPDAVKALDEYFHSLDFSLYLILFASQSSTAADLVDFSLGYGCHLAEDMVGHHSNSYLTPKWDHEIEFAADTFFLKEKKQNVMNMPAEMPKFIADANVYVTNIIGEKVLPIHNESSIQGSIEKYQDEVKEEVTLAHLNVVYREEMVKFDFCGATSFQEALSHLSTAGAMSETVCEFLLATAADMKSPADVPKAHVKIVDYIESQFDRINGTIC